jgi:alanine dehydrogenase
MKIAILRELNDEFRVSLVPTDVKKLTESKYEVYVQKGAGALAGFSDSEYLNCGAKIESYNKVIKNADIVLKVSHPDKEIKLLKQNQLLISFLYLANNPKILKKLIDKKINAVGLESIRINDQHACVVPCEQAKGKFGVILGAYNLSKLNHNAVGKTYGAINNNESKSHFVVLNGSYAGYEAAKTILAMGADLTMLENEEYLIEQLESDKLLKTLAHLNNCKFNILKAEFEILNQLMPTIDVLINTNQSPEAKTSRRITNRMINSLRKGSVYIDLAVENGLGSETEQQPNTIKKPIADINGVTQSALENIPSLFAHSLSITCSQVITDCLLTFDLNKSVIGNVANNNELLNAIQTYNGYLTNKVVSESIHLTYTPIKTLIK